MKNQNTNGKVKVKKIQPSHPSNHDYVILNQDYKILSKNVKLK